ncbi:hypothetical protein DIS24_g1970 [Lasiodiplodia hormozganensis]|uniref:Subtelomeric hrmA-associated cluster protein AFUB-079030/YDR124W-like helical bundle domain-containing protein n=1 Tax=Lasiodiplodia hormozganensis TaxID=869390 RepID=A0AA39Z1D4_9PEZI|nr:hypothetical protein DIS24_g1970 [Lasiodiplodia hormozganensis]
MVQYPAECRLAPAGSAKWHPQPSSKTKLDATPPAAAASRMSSQSVSSQQPRTAPAPSPSRALAQALRRDCNIAAHAFVVVGLDERGDAFVLPSDKFDYVRPQLARTPQWRQLVSHVDSLPPQFVRGGPQVYASDEPAASEWVDAASQVTTDSDESRRASLSQPNQRARNSEKSKVKIKSPAAEPVRPRKRQRSTSRNQSLAEDDDDENEDWSDAVGVDIEPEEQQVVRFPIEDRAQVLDILGRRLDQMQQLACKVILKAWIRAIEPKKQSNYPYVGSDKKKKQEAEKSTQKKRSKPKDGPDAPPWWPTTHEDWWRLMPHPECGTMDEVRHKEPDHLRKPERLVLGVHILLHQAQKEGGIDLLVHSTKDCVLQFDQDNRNGDDRKGKRDLFLNDIYLLAQHWSDYVTDGIDGDTMIGMKCYPKHALQNKKASSGSSRKRQRQDSSVDTQEVQEIQKSQHGQEQEDLVQSTRALELENQSWDYSHPNGLPDPSPQQVNNFFPSSNNDFRSYVAPVGKPFSDASDLQPAYQQAPMMPPQIYDDRYGFDAKQPPNYVDNPTYPMSRDPSYVSQPSNYDWRTVQSNSSFSPSSTASLAQSSNTSYATPSNTNFPGAVNFSFGNNPQLSPQHNYSPGSQVGMSAASPAMGQAMAVSGPMSMMPGIRSQSSTYDEPPYSNTFRTGSLSHPNIPYNMNSSYHG